MAILWVMVHNQWGNKQAKNRIKFTKEQIELKAEVCALACAMSKVWHLQKNKAFGFNVTSQSKSCMSPASYPLLVHSDLGSVVSELREEIPNIEPILAEKLLS